MHIDTIPNRNSRPAYLLRESVREGKRVRKRALANLSSLPLDQIETLNEPAIAGVPNHRVIGLGGR